MKNFDTFRKYYDANHAKKFEEKRLANAEKQLEELKQKLDLTQSSGVVAAAILLTRVSDDYFLDILEIYHDWLND
ncbi:hypothetical protein [Gudongella sp. SC589]|uniref:hypothetical protein n=1 Tax=Gudongella sp. SC589 TaxID=3385990 RepID=UPI0039048AA2